MSILDDVLDAIRSRLLTPAPAPTQQTADSMRSTGGTTWNPWSGATGGAKVTDTRPALPAWLSADEIDWLVTSDGLARRVTYGPVEDAMGRGWRVDEDGERDVTRDLDARLDLEGRITEVGTSARQYGGAWLWMVVEGDDDLTEPLGEGPHEIAAVHVIDQREARPYGWDDDPASGRFTRPTIMDISLRREDASYSVGLVHTSRLIYVPGLPMSRSQTSPPERRGYDLSVPQAYWEAVRDLSLTQGAGAALAVEKSMPWVRLTAKRDAQTGQPADFRGAIRSWARMRSSWGVTVLGEGDEVGRTDAALTGLREVVLSGYERIAAIEGYPLSALVGQAPAGLSTDDEAGRRTYARMIGRWRRLVADRILRRVYEVAMGPGSREIVWPPVDPPTEREVAEIAKMYAETDAVLVQSMVLDASEARDRWSGDDVQDRPTVGDFGEIDDPEPEPDEDASADADTYAVPASARNNARMALRWREEHPDEIRGMTEVGWRRARQLATEARVGRDTVAAMSGFARHRASYEAARAKDSDKPWTEAAIVAWLGWGGTSGIEWARGITGASED